jgi:hypothetical protein
VVEAAVSPGRRRVLLAAWVLLAALVGAIAALEYSDRGVADETDPRRLLPVAAGDLGALEIADRAGRHRFERDAGGAWFYHGAHAGDAAEHTHAPDPALSERIERAVAALGRARIERQFPAGADAGVAYGVSAPELVILVYRPEASQPVAQYAVGAIAPDTVSRYVALVGTPTVVTIPNYQIDNLMALVQAAAAAAAPAVSRR